MKATTMDIGRALDDGPFSGLQKMVIFLAAMAIVLDGFDGQMIGFAIPLIIKEWGITKAAFAPAVAAGLIGMAVAGQPGLPLPAPVRRLVLNDVGPVIQWQALQRIGQYLGYPARFDSLQQAADAMWAISTSFGPHTQQQWLELSRPMLRSLPDGGLTLHYDPAIAVPFRALTQEAAAAGESVLWQLYDQIQAQTLLLRGAQSDLLSRETAQAMQARGPKARCVEFEGVGHAPTLIAADQVAVVQNFLLAAPVAESALAG